ncbi:MAG: ferric reductase-like transmembrane domain-containing protein [Anaerolineales bacterium]|nr:ferric reductase-like transmembrane domain-containing protein [Anaerolineales bacterium]
MKMRQTAVATPQTIGRGAAFTASLLLGILLGGFLLTAGWLLAQTTTLDEQLVTFLGLSAKTGWYVSRASGTVAYLLLAGSTVWGLLLSTKIIKETVPAALSLGMHNILSWLAIALAGVHAAALLFDSYYTYTLADLTIPFVGPYRPEWVGLGIIGLYLMALTSASFSWRRRLGQAWWRRLHYLTFAAYLLVTVHGAAAGTDSANPGMTALYWGSGLLVLFLTNYRLVAGKTAK